MAALVLCCAAYADDLCNPGDILGPYGFQLAGVSTISGAETPVASVGRLVFDGKGKVEGYSSVNFNGLFLGNPVSGSYEIKVDCTLTWSLQDDSGAFQHFTGKASPGGAHVDFHQVDPRTTSSGVMEKVADGCNAAAFRGRFDLSITGGLVAHALAQADGNGGIVVTRGDSTTSGTYTVDSDCFVELAFGLAQGDSSELVKLRGVLVDGGKEVMAVQTDPEHVSAARFTARAE